MSVINALHKFKKNKKKLSESIKLEVKYHYLKQYPWQPLQGSLPGFFLYDASFGLAPGRKHSHVEILVKLSIDTRQHFSKRIFNTFLLYKMS